MVIYLLHQENITSFTLPKKVGGSYILNDYYDSKKIDLIKIEAENNEWIAYSNDDIKISYNNTQVKSIKLMPYNFYLLTLYNSESIIMYICPGYEEQYTLKMLNSESTITVGSGNKCNIFYNNCRELQLELKYTNGEYSFKNLDPAIPVYVNLLKRDKGYLKNFDIIFIMGLKIILIGPYICINNPNGSVAFFGNSFIEASFEYIVPNQNSTGRVYKDFYNESDYFAKSPVFQNKLERIKVKIADPPSISKNKTNPIIMEIVPSGIMSLSSLLSSYFVIRKYKNGETDQESFVLSIVMCGIFLFTGICWPFIQRGYEKLSYSLTIGKSKRSYKRYLKTKKESINEMRLKFQASLKNIYIDSEECSTAILKRTPYLFSMNKDSEKFLSIRLGIGKIPFDMEFEYSKPEFSVEQNKLYEDIDKMIEEQKYLEDVPVVISLKECNILAFLTKELEYKYSYSKNILFQIITLHSFSDLKIVVFTQSTGAEEFSFLKNLNHNWDNSMSIRFFATNLNEAADISTYLENIFISRAKDSKKEQDELINNDDAYYLIICDCIAVYRDINIINDILNSETNLGFSLIMFDNKLTNIPNRCTHFVEYNLIEGTYFESEMEDNKIRKFTPEYLDTNNFINIYKYSTLLANIPMKVENNASKDLPSKLGFLEMYGVGKVDLLNSEQRWENADVVNTLSAPVGVDANGNLINLDLHEKRHGPHGLIAGMTGSGKSEFIITYILSLAVNYNPNEVQFVLIDYKGGGLAGAFENRQTGIKLPHLVGTITNLDKAEMNRTLASIQSELQRRQKKFNEVKERLNTGTIDIYKYQKLYREGKISEPMAHLFIISDEFAELKAQQPDFMDQLVSAARIGRSLGIHLILATQKPSGVVDDQIWSNSKFKVCCKVQTADDSVEMLGKADAAYLKDAGRFYLQVGYDIYYILGQSAYSGTKYLPSDKIITNVDNSLVFINNFGENIKSIDNDNKEKNVQTVELGEELTNVLKYIIKVAEKGNFHPKKLWLDNIPNHIYLENLKNKYKNIIQAEKGIINPPVGEYDDPENQSQGLVTLPITIGGNCFIAGVSGSGKSTFLSTIIFSTIISHSTNEVNFYIIDFANEKLKKFAKVPQVGNVFTIDNIDKVNILLNRIVNEIKQRKKILSKVDLDYLSYIKTSNQPILPNYIVVINGFDAFKEQFVDFIDDKFLSIIRESNKYGISFIVTATDTSSMYNAQLDQFPQKIAFKFNDPDAYNDLLQTKLIPADNPGRGLIKIDGVVYQFQASLILPDEILNQTINNIAAQLSNMMQKAPQIPIMPDFVTASLFNDKVTSLSSLPIGYNINTIETSYYDFDVPISLIISTKSKYMASFINSLVTLMNNIQKLKVIILDGNKKLRIEENSKIKYYDSGFANLIKFLHENLNKYEPSTENRIVIFISGYENIQQHLKEYFGENLESSITLEDLIANSLNSNLFRFVICGQYTNTSKLENEKWYGNVSKKNGIIVATAFDEQDFISAKRLPNEYSLDLDETNAIVVRDSIKEIISYISEQ